MISNVIYSIIFNKLIMIIKIDYLSIIIRIDNSLSNHKIEDLHNVYNKLYYFRCCIIILPNKIYNFRHSDHEFVAVIRVVYC